MKRVAEKFRETGSVRVAKHTGRPKTNTLNVAIKAVRESAFTFAIVDKNFKFQKTLQRIFAKPPVSMLKKFK